MLVSRKISLSSYNNINTIKSQYSPGFTIVELLIVVVVIAILAAIAIVSYSGITAQAEEAAMKSALRSASNKVSVERIQNSSYPASLDEVGIDDETDIYILQYSSDVNSFCITAFSEKDSGKSFHIASGEGSIREGPCNEHTPPGVAVDGDFMQTISDANCPAVRTLAVDARDNRTYWVQKFSDGKCWMLTNLAYAGGGSDTYGDAMSAIVNGTSSTGLTYASPRYYVHSSRSNPTVYPDEPSTHVDTGGGVNSTKQYGYYYNRCAAMGGQGSTGACNYEPTPMPDPSISICPANWRLPTTDEFVGLNSAVNDGRTNTDAGLRSNWLAQVGGYWMGASNFAQAGSYGHYWSSSAYVEEGQLRVRSLYFYNISVRPAQPQLSGSYGLTVRCVAS